MPSIDEDMMVQTKYITYSSEYPILTPFIADSTYEQSFSSGMDQNDELRAKLQFSTPPQSTPPYTQQGTVNSVSANADPPPPRTYAEEATNTSRQPTQTRPSPLKPTMAAPPPNPPPT
ncbi:hypothetical protein BGX38DRAFT_1267981 [Terfezia claveryi]|nr:hypothetical protein BGX38DRAFT_1267981 [Terfezia claveryi]